MISVRPSRAWSPWVAGVLALCFGLCANAAASDEGMDTLVIRVEAGVSTDVSNEQFFEDDLDDTVFTKPRRVSYPEARVAAVLSADLSGTRGGRREIYSLSGATSLGDRLQQGSMALRWRREVGANSNLDLAPRFEYRRDHTYDRVLTEWRAEASTRTRRRWGDGAFRSELGAKGEVLRSSGRGSEYLLDRQGGRVFVALSRSPLWGAEWRLDYRFGARAFPDSAVRDHFEQAGGFEWRRVSTAGHSVELEANLERRSALAEAPTARDDFWQTTSSFEGDWRLGSTLVLRGRVEAEGMRYDIEDDIAFFDYELVRARIGPRAERERGSVAAGPRIEILSCRRSPAERYREAGGYVEWELLRGGSWWSLTPAAGWRHYAESSDPLDAGASHSSFAFYELSGLADQEIPGAVRMRLLFTMRLESHVEPADDARSLYFSLDIRRLF